MPLKVGDLVIPTNTDRMKAIKNGSTTQLDEVKCIFRGATISIWKKQKYYYVAFSGNGATSGNMDPQTLPVAVATKLRDNAYKRTGYSFFGWSSAAGGSREYTNGQTVTDIAAAGATKTLYALWQAITYYIRFNPNGGAGSMGRQEILYDASTALAANTFTRSYFAFVGWGTSAGGPRVYTDQQAVRNLKTAHGDVANLYALWRASSLVLNTKDRCTPVTGGWMCRKDWEPEFEAEYNGMVGTIVAGNGARINIYTKNAIDFTYISRISINIETGYCGGHFYAGISSDPYADGIEAGIDLEWKDDGMIRQEVDVSGIAGSKYFKIVMYPNNHCGVILENITCS